MITETRDKYLRAVTELFSTLTHETYTQIYEGDFYARHGLKPSFLLALRDLDALEYDVVSERGYRQTPKLATLTPEEIVAQMKASGRKAAKGVTEEATDPKPEPPIPTPPTTDEEGEPDRFLADIPYRRTTDSSADGNRGSGTNTQPESDDLLGSFEVRIERNGFKLHMRVWDAGDVGRLKRIIDIVAEG